ncbi:MAG TPA: DUF642 domain-containing protein [Rhizomicrobium sp.]|jgi:hypothetical protein
MVRARILAAAALAAGFAFTGFAFTPVKAATIIQDGNFNDPLAAGTFQTVTGGNFFGNGNAWQVQGNSVDVIGNYWTAPTPGGGSVDLDGNAPGSIAQTFAVSAGTYQLSFYLSGNPDGGLGTKNVEVKVGDQDIVVPYTLTGLNSRSNMDYVLETLIFKSSGGGDVLSFLSQDKDSPFGPVIGGVSIAAVPEAATWIMMILGFGGIGMMLRSQRRQSSPA